jgi:hypothetical protein
MKHQLTPTLRIKLNIKFYREKYVCAHGELKYRNVGNKSPSDGVAHRGENGYLIDTAEKT